MNLLPRVSEGLDCSLIGSKRPVLTSPLTTGGVARQRSSRLFPPSTSSPHHQLFSHLHLVQLVTERIYCRSLHSNHYVLFALGSITAVAAFPLVFSSTLSSDRPPLSVQITKHSNTTALYALSHSLLSSRDRCSDLSRSDRSACSPQRLAIDRLHFF